LNDYEMQHNAEVELFTKPSLLILYTRVIVKQKKQPACRYCGCGGAVFNLF